jgi:hypothetical protein
MTHLNILSTWFLMFKTVFQLQLVASSSLIEKTPMIVDKSTLCFCFFWETNGKIHCKERHHFEQWHLGKWVEKSMGHSEPNIISLAYTTPPQSDQSTPFLMQSCDQVQKRLTLLTHHWMLKSQHPVSLIISTMYQPTRDQLVMTGPRQKFSFFKLPPKFKALHNTTMA